MQRKSPPALVDRGRDDLPRWPGTEHMPLFGWKSTMCQFGSLFRGRIGDERIICALRGGRAPFGRGQDEDKPAARRAWGGPSPPRTGVAPRFSGGTGRNGGDATGVEGARRRRADRDAGPEVRICSVPSQNAAFSGPPIGTWSVSRQPAPIGGGTGGLRAQSPWLEPRLLDCRSGEIGEIWQPPRLMD